MKKILFILPILLLLAGCGPSRAELEAQAREKGITVDSAIAEYHSGHFHGDHPQDFTRYVKTATVDGCQYLIYGESIIHKANCNNSIHQSLN